MEDQDRINSTVECSEETEPTKEMPTVSAEQVPSPTRSSSDPNPSGDDGAVAARPWHKDFLLVPCVLAVFLLDQLTKALVRETIALGQSIPEHGIFRLTHAINTGSAFGLFPNQTILLICASIIGISILVYFYRRQRNHSPLFRISLSLQLGGAIGNLMDRLTLGYVVDFIDIGVWPIFNLADSSIVVGILTLIWIIWIAGHKSHSELLQSSQADDQ